MTLFVFHVINQMLNFTIILKTIQPNLNRWVHDSALEEDHVSDGISDHENEGMVYIKHPT